VKFCVEFLFRLFLFLFLSCVVVPVFPHKLAVEAAVFDSRDRLDLPVCVTLVINVGSGLAVIKLFLLNFLLHR
jgi:hypothetical protein